MMSDACLLTAIGAAPLHRCANFEISAFDSQFDALTAWLSCPIGVIFAQTML